MFHDLDKTLEQLLTDPQIPAWLAVLKVADIRFDVPDKNYPPGTATAAILNLHLYQTHENRVLRDPEPIIEKRGGIYIRRRPPLRVDCSYMVTAWSKKTAEQKIEEEHQLLSEAMLWLSRFPIISTNYLVGSLMNPPFPHRTEVALPDGDKNMGEFWTALGQPPRPSFNLLVTIALDLQKEEEGPLVTTTSVSFGQKEQASDKQMPETQEVLIQIGGRVFNNANPTQGISGASVLLTEWNESETTDAEGRFSFLSREEGKSFRNLRARFYTLQVSASGFQPAVKRINVVGSTEEYEVGLGGGQPPPPPPPPPPAPKSLLSKNIDFSFTEAGNVVTLTGAVTVKDGNGAAVAGANVSSVWTLPDGTLRTQSANTGTDGVARFVIQNGRGNYRLKITNLVKTDYVFDLNSSGQVLEKGISIFASDKLIARTLELSGIEKENEPLLIGRARVFVRDENDVPVLEANVRLRWTFRNQAGTTTEEQTAISKTDGIAWFTLQKGEGRYRAEVIDIEKGAHIFLPDQGTTQKEHNLPNVRLSSGSIFSTARPEADGTFTVKSSTTITAEAVPPEVPDALLIARWELPGNPPPEKWQERRTDARGNISFEINNGRGLYRFFISDIFKDGFTFNVANSGLSDEITIP